ncbi:MAG: hypothetical protein K2X27_22335 [Candidatus Obscuribacterales bacterium]|nr:hypothetical protein [Candidatus Obscuribacterales bacterium]
MAAPKQGPKAETRKEPAKPAAASKAPELVENTPAAGAAAEVKTQSPKAPSAAEIAANAFSDYQKRMEAAFTASDANGDQYLSLGEIAAASRNAPSDQMGAYKELIENFSRIKDLKNDEWGWESQISKEDLRIYLKEQKENRSKIADIREMSNWASENYDKTDSFRDGFLSLEELTSRYNDKNISPAEKSVLGKVIANYQGLEDAHDDEFGFENDGPTKADFLAYKEQFEATAEAKSLGELDLATEKAALLEKVKNDPRFDDAARKSLQANMKDLETRAMSSNMDLKQVAETYFHARRLLDNPGTEPLSALDNALLSTQIVESAAHPERLDQGSHNTCNVNSLETVVFYKSPAVAAELIANIALSGRHLLKDGTSVAVDKDSLAKDADSLLLPTPEGARSYASQLFQIAAVNAYYAKFSPHIKYEQRASTGAGDTGERLVDYSRKPPVEVLEDGVPARHPMFAADQVFETLKILQGKAARDSVLFAAGYGYDTGRGTMLESKEEFKQTLDTLKKEGRFPVVLSVNTVMEPFWSDSGGGLAGGSGGGHVVVITDYLDGKVLCDNSWGRAKDHLSKERGIDVHDLYIAMQSRPEKAIAMLERDVKWNKENKTVDIFKEFEIVRLKRAAGQINDQSMYEQLGKAYIDTQASWEKLKAENKLDPKEQERVRKLVGQSLEGMAPDMRLALGELILRAPGEKLISPEQSKEMLARIFDSLAEGIISEGNRGSLDQGKRDTCLSYMQKIEEQLALLPDPLKEDFKKNHIRPVEEKLTAAWRLGQPQVAAKTELAAQAVRVRPARSEKNVEKQEKHEAAKPSHTAGSVKPKPSHSVSKNESKKENKSPKKSVRK